MDKVIKVILLINNERLISEIVEIGADVGEPDCRLIKPHIICESTLTPWMVNDTNQTEFMISSDKIITIADPKPGLLENYLDKVN